MICNKNGLHRAILRHYLGIPLGVSMAEKHDFSPVEQKYKVYPLLLRA